MKVKSKAGIPIALFFIPIYGWNGDNLIYKSGKLIFIKTLFLLKLQMFLFLQSDMLKKPLRMLIQAVYKIKGVDTVAAGRIESDILKVVMGFKSHLLI